MNYGEYIAYHRRGDAGAEERMIAAICESRRLSAWDAFRLTYFYSTTYHIPSALDMLRGQRDIRKLKFRTDRRYVRCHGAFERMLKELGRGKQTALEEVRTTQQAFDAVSGWYYFGRYAAFLFLEAYCNVFKPHWRDDVAFGWEAGENYTKGAIEITGTDDRAALDDFLADARRDTGDNSFAIETSLCAAAKISKGTRWDGYYAERMLADAEDTRWASLVYSLAGK